VAHAVVSHHPYPAFIYPSFHEAALSQVWICSCDEDHVRHRLLLVNFAPRHSKAVGLLQGGLRQFYAHNICDANEIRQNEKLKLNLWQLWLWRG